MVQTQIATAHVGNVCNEVVKKVAEVEDVDPLELTPPLSEVIDSDALESLFANNLAVGKVVFNYNSCEVSVFSDGYVSVKSHGT
ncbi:HalOD1 output domain-containing protein [Halorussus aquaticus]|uniref:HalOD1 output domain-containing protein n=1 Tax=Halorussus aquaticus TaxID=2953748 RepID=A0ABD5Q7B2_9EURY|nr:HalOD1 output domain-containing protein [Halorussus aquaticus]